ncbi:4'-phosphopantetheinyl transferase superfamily protein [Streptomyces sp. CJ_13]|uniref:4'-phosphopantetheinyl transferase superfamily protein n=1 Tax=unclassified Streptomyces TaxID=2593676 RepID=UPI000F3AA400|nr:MULTISPECIES: 4'-phosphopantetheinyl transferase superfamily protein [unclassified Streptomyces]AYV32419.1 4'-phosphopantetheinyl transferase Npt [Streptomyces sp. ADI95-16]MBT1186254.1 4'-phosphopantetheinyl transferase superfamily protein [Streptomyces sp. CJ_13]
MQRTPQRPLAAAVVQLPLPDTAIALFPATPGAAASLHEEERRLLPRLPSARRPGFVAGRAAAGRALELLDVQGPVLRDGRRPLFPPGAQGSISHATGPIGASIASTHPDVIAVGIDLERTDRLGRGADRLVCTMRERSWVARARRPESRLSVLFSAKEAIYKALHGISTRPPVFHDVEIGLEGDRLDIRLAPELLQENRRIDGWFQLLPGKYVLASVAVISATGTE